MTAIAFDTLAYAAKLKALGYPDNQAEGHATLQAEVVEKIMESHLATKQDLKELELTIEIKMKDLENRLFSFLIKATSISVSIIVCSIGALGFFLKSVH